LPPEGPAIGGASCTESTPVQAKREALGTKRWNTRGRAEAEAPALRGVTRAKAAWRRPPHSCGEHPLAEWRCQRRWTERSRTAARSQPGGPTARKQVAS